MRRRDWLLLLIGDGLDPIRIQKGMFLFAMESDVPPAEKYSFEPYNWGPFSQPIYSDLENLVSQGMIERVPVTGASYHRYRRTHLGDQAASRATSRADDDALAALATSRATVAGVSFDALLKAVYRKYPRFAEKSLFRE